MKKSLTLSSIILICCFCVFAQTNGYYHFSQNQAGPSRSFTASSGDETTPATATASQKTTVQGCLAQSVDGAFILTDPSGNSYQLNDSTSRLAQFVGQEIRVDGFGISGELVPGAMSALKGSAQQIDVTRVRKIANSCKSHVGNR